MPNGYCGKTASYEARVAGALIGCLVKSIIGDTLPFTQGDARSRMVGVRRITHHPHYALSHEGGDTDE